MARISITTQHYGIDGDAAAYLGWVTSGGAPPTLFSDAPHFWCTEGSLTRYFIWKVVAPVPCLAQNGRHCQRGATFAARNSMNANSAKHDDRWQTNVFLRHYAGNNVA